MGGGKNLEKRLIEAEFEKRKKQQKKIYNLRQNFKALQKSMRG